MSFLNILSEPLKYFEQIQNETSPMHLNLGSRLGSGFKSHLAFIGGSLLCLQQEHSHEVTPPSAWHGRQYTNLHGPCSNGFGAYNWPVPILVFWVSLMVVGTPFFWGECCCIECLCTMMKTIYHAITNMSLLPRELGGMGLGLGVCEFQALALHFLATCGT